MIVFILALKIFLGIVFLSTCIEKVYHYSSHKQNIKNYGMMNEKFIPIIALLDVLLESAVALFLIIGVFDVYALSFGVILLLFYTFAIILNLTKGNRFKCGCGGIAGDSMISWKLVIRNFLLILSLMFLIVSYRYLVIWNESIHNLGLDLFSVHYLLLINIVLLLTFSYITAKRIFKVNKMEVE
ncbi:MauE/DoxX family redox-associated membrane protein [Virgibacillus sp. DJP39]|uniref:MauE/DoxX family redox-associated membrane protein n=1 Tax=Virgibacillus sp. DJP39 TaxID=3409790 RepID=UPI003BB613B7